MDSSTCSSYYLIYYAGLSSIPVDYCSFRIYNVIGVKENKQERILS